MNSYFFLLLVLVEFALSACSNTNFAGGNLGPKKAGGSTDSGSADDAISVGYQNISFVLASVEASNDKQAHVVATSGAVGFDEGFDETDLRDYQINIWQVTSLSLTKTPVDGVLDGQRLGSAEVNADGSFESDFTMSALESIIFAIDLRDSTPEKLILLPRNTQPSPRYLIWLPAKNLPIYPISRDDLPTKLEDSSPNGSASQLPSTTNSPTPPIPGSEGSKTVVLLNDAAGHAFPAADATGTYAWSEPTVDATYYRNVSVTYQVNLTAAYLGYLTPNSYFTNYCGSVMLREGNLKSNNPPAPGTAWASFTDDLSSCSPQPIVLQWRSGHFFCGGNLSVRNVVITGIKDPPTAADQSVAVNVNTPTGYIKASASDPQGAKMTTYVIAKPIHGTLVWNDTKFNYTPATCYVGGDSFKYYVAENTQNLASAIVTVSLNVKNAGKAPENCP